MALPVTSVTYIRCLRTNATYNGLVSLEAYDQRHQGSCSPIACGVFIQNIPTTYGRVTSVWIIGWRGWHGRCHLSKYYFEGILPKGPYLPCVSMAGRALLAGYPPFVSRLLRICAYKSEYPNIIIWCVVVETCNRRNSVLQNLMSATKNRHL